MNVFVGHTAACIFWLTATQYDVEHLRPTRLRPSKISAHTSKQVKLALENTRFVDWPHTVCVAADAPVNSSSNLRCIRQTIFPTHAFLQYTQDVFVASPELTFLQMASVLPFDELVLLGNFLCGGFYQDDYSNDHPPTRQPATSPKLLLEAACSPKAPNSRIAQRAIKYISPNSASPMEALIGLWIVLPQMNGGYGTSKPLVNYEIPLPYELQRYTGRNHVVADFCWPEKKLTIEYDSDLEHGNAAALTRDATKRNALQELGFTVITLTKGQAFNEDKMDRVAQQIATFLGKRKRPRQLDYEMKKLDMRSRTIEWVLQRPEVLLANRLNHK